MQDTRKGVFYVLHIVAGRGREPGGSRWRKVLKTVGFQGVRNFVSKISDDPQWAKSLKMH